MSPRARRRAENVEGRPAKVRIDIPSIPDRIRSYVTGLIDTSKTRIDAFTEDVEKRVLRFLMTLVWGLVALVSLTFGIIFAMLTIVFGFDLPPKYALGIPALFFLATGLVALLFLWRKRKS